MASTIDQAKHAADLVVRMIEDLEEGNKIQPSDIRSSTIKILYQVEVKLRDGLLENDNDKMSDGIAEANFAAEALQIYVDLAEQEWAYVYANIVQGFALNDHHVLLRLAWANVPTKYKGKNRARIPKDVVDHFNVNLMARLELDLAKKAELIGRVRQTGTLNVDDVNPSSYLKVGQRVTSTRLYKQDIFVTKTAMSAAQISTREYVKAKQTKRRAAALKKALEDAEPSLFGKIWSVVGYDSWSDFFVDVALTAATGGASKFYRWGRQLNRTRKRVKSLKKSTKHLKRLSEDLTRRINYLNNTRRNVRKRAKKLRKAINSQRKMIENLEQLKTTLKTVQAGTKIADLVNDVFGSSPMKLIRTVHTTVVADLLAQQSGQGGKTSKAGEEFVRKAISEFLLTYTPFDKIRAMRDNIVRSAVLRREKTQADLFLKLFFTLVGRQIISRLVLKMGRKQQIALSTKEYTEIVVSSYLAAGQDLLIQFGLENPVTSRVWTDVFTVIRKYVSNLIAPLVGSLAQTIANDLSNRRSRPGR